MQRISCRYVIITLVLLLCVVGQGWADSIVITYASGKTQTVQLDENSDNIRGVQYLKGSAPQAQPAAAAPVQQVPRPPVAEPKKTEEKQGDGTVPIRFKWQKPLMGD